MWHYPDFIFTHMIMHPHNTKITTNTTVHKAQRSLWPPEFKQRAKLSNRKLKCHALFEHHRDQIYHQETIERVEMLNFLFKAHIKKKPCPIPLLRSSHSPMHHHFPLCCVPLGRKCPGRTFKKWPCISQLKPSCLYVTYSLASCHKV